MQPDLRRTRPRNGRVLWWILAVLTAVIAVGALLVAIDPPWLSEELVLTRYAMESAASAGAVDFWQVVADVLAPWPLRVALLLAALAALGWRHLQVAVWLLVTVALETVLAPLSKLLFRRERPDLDDAVTAIGGFSFPSGHAAAAGMTATALILLTLVLARRGSWLRRGFLVVWVALALFIAAGRLCLGVHYPTDVVVGLALGSMCAYAPWLAITYRRETSRVARGLSGHHRVVAVVYNPIKVGDIEGFKTRVREVATREGFAEPLWFETTIEDPGAGQAHAALAAGAELILIAGGDGTLRMVSEEVARTGVPIGVLPQGTGNLLARNLALPLNLTEALEVAFTGDEQAIDLVRLSTDARLEATEPADEDGDAEAPREPVGTSFLVMAGLGMDAAIMSGVRDDLKAKVGYLAYFVSGVRALAFPATRVKITVDDEEPRTYRARTVVVGNVGFLQAGIPLLPEAEIDDGLLDVVVIAPKRFLGWLSIVWRVMTRGKRSNERLERLTGTRVTIVAERATPMQLDGDPIGEGTEITAEIGAGLLLLRVPRPGSISNRQ